MKHEFTVTVEVDDDQSAENVIEQLTGLLTGKVKEYFTAKDFDIELVESEDASDDDELEIDDEESDEDELA